MLADVLTRSFLARSDIFGSGSGRMHVKHLADMSPGALVQRAAVFPRWRLDLTGRSPLLPQRTERL